MQLIGGRAGPCEVYPTELCEAIVNGPKDQIYSDGISSITSSVMMVHHEDERCWDEFDNDLSGKLLRSDLVHEARREEIEIFYNFPVYGKVPIGDAYYHTQQRGRQ